MSRGHRLTQGSWMIHAVISQHSFLSSLASVKRRLRRAVLNYSLHSSQWPNLQNKKSSLSELAQWVPWQLCMQPPAVMRWRCTSCVEVSQLLLMCHLHVPVFCICCRIGTGGDLCDMSIVISTSLFYLTTWVECSDECSLGEARITTNLGARWSC